MSFLITLFIYLSFTVNFNFEPVRKRIYNRSAYPVKTSRYFISSTAEFSACMENRKNNFYRRYPCFMINADRNAAAIVNDRNRIILINCHMNCIAKTGQSFINGIIHYFINKMMKSSAGRTSNIHSGSFPNRFKTFQYLNLICSVFISHSDNHTFLSA